jgi:hypothetical protein
MIDQRAFSTVPPETSQSLSGLGQELPSLSMSANQENMPSGEIANPSIGEDLLQRNGNLFLQGPICRGSLNIECSKVQDLTIWGWIWGLIWVAGIRVSKGGVR